MIEYKNKWKTNSLNRPFWKEVLEGRNIKKVNFSKTSIKSITLDSGEEIFLDGWENQSPLYIMDRRPRFLHTSMAGSYYIDCKILKKKGKKYTIEYFDPIIKETETRTVDASEIEE